MRKHKNNTNIVFLIILFPTVIALASSKPALNIPNNYRQIQDTIYVYDTVYQHDTVYLNLRNKGSLIFFDTLNINEKNFLNFPNVINDFRISLKYSTNIPEQKKLSPNSLEFTISPLYNNISFSGDLIYSKASKLNNSALSPLIGLSSGINFIHRRNKTLLTSGIHFSVLQNDFKFLSSQYKIDTIRYYKFFQSTTINIDTIYFINIDTLLATGDTIYEIFQDTNYINSLDSSLQLKKDTTVNKILDKKTNRLVYFEIPFYIGKTYKYSNFSLTPELGIIAGIILNSDGKLVSLADLNQSIDIKQETKLAFLNLSFYGGIKFDFYMNKKINFTLKPFYRRNINSIFREYPLITRNNIVGIQFGIRYFFN